MQIKSLTSEAEISQSYDAFLELRPHLSNAENFVNQVQIQQKEGYRLIAVSQDDEIVACAGFRIMHMLVCGKFLYIDDLITKEKWRGKGFAKILLDHIIQIAENEGCAQVKLDSGYARFAAHKQYLKHGFELNAHHFALKLK